MSKLYCLHVVNEENEEASLYCQDRDSSGGQNEGSVTQRVY